MKADQKLKIAECFKDHNQALSVENIADRLRETDLTKVGFWVSKMSEYIQHASIGSPITYRLSRKGLEALYEDGFADDEERV